MDYEKNNGQTDAIDRRYAEEIVSQYIDFQSRLTNNLYVTAGIRFDDHSAAGSENSKRTSIAYLFNDKNTKLKSSYGTGIKYPALYEFYKNEGTTSLVAETGRSYDIGIEKAYPERGIKFDITYFNHKYEDMIEGQKRTGWVVQNVSGTVRSKGLEIFSQYKLIC